MHTKPIVAALAAACLAGCAANGATPVVNADLTQDEQTVQAIAEKTCGYLPTAESVASIFLSDNAEYSSITAVANAICSAVTAKGASPHGRVPMVAGVRVRGHFVRQAH